MNVEVLAEMSNRLKRAKELQEGAEAQAASFLARAIAAEDALRLAKAALADKSDECERLRDELLRVVG